MTDLLTFAANFAHSLVNGDSESAHKMLSNDLRNKLTVKELVTQLGVLADDMGGITGTGEPMVILEEWPDMSASDRAMIYVPLEGDVYSEAVTVTVSEADNGLTISGVEWGRP